MRLRDLKIDYTLISSEVKGGRRKKKGTKFEKRFEKIEGAPVMLFVGA